VIKSYYVAVQLTHDVDFLLGHSLITIEANVTN